VLLLITIQQFFKFNIRYFLVEVYQVNILKLIEEPPRGGYLASKYQFNECQGEESVTGNILNVNFEVVASGICLKKGNGSTRIFCDGGVIRENTWENGNCDGTPTTTRPIRQDTCQSGVVYFGCR
jgi:hypothetical protein